MAISGPFLSAVAHLDFSQVFFYEIQREQTLTKQKDLITGFNRLLNQIDWDQKLGAVGEKTRRVLLHQFIRPVGIIAAFSSLFLAWVGPEWIEATAATAVIRIERRTWAQGCLLTWLDGLFQWHVRQVKIYVSGLFGVVFVKHIRVIPNLSITWETIYETVI